MTFVLQLDTFKQCFFWSIGPRESSTRPAVLERVPFCFRAGNISFWGS